MAGHYVDDTGAVDAGPIAQGGFEEYERMCKLLRIRLKKSKRQTPTAVRDALGAVIALSPEAAQVKPSKSGERCRDRRWTVYRPTRREAYE